MTARCPECGADSVSVWIDEPDASPTGADHAVCVACGHTADGDDAATFHVVTCANPSCDEPVNELHHGSAYCGNDCEIEHLRDQLEEARRPIIDGRALLVGLREVYEAREVSAAACAGGAYDDEDAPAPVDPDEAENYGNAVAWGDAKREIDELLAKSSITYDDPFAWVTQHMLREVAIRLERDADPDVDPDDVQDATVAAVRAWWSEFVEADGADWDDYGEHFVNALHHGIRKDIANGHWKLGEGRP